MRLIYFGGRGKSASTPMTWVIEVRLSRFCRPCRTQRSFLTLLGCCW